MYPRKVKLFIPWSKAMVEGATVDKPSYPGTRKGSQQGKGKAPIRQQRRRRRKRKRHHGSKD